MINALFVVHVFSGALAVLAGAIAASVRKGGRLHIRAGRLFVVFMALSSVLGAVLGLIKFEQFFITFFAGILGTYLVVSGWLAAHQANARHRGLDGVLSALNAMTFVALASIGALAFAQPDGSMFGFAGANYLFLACMSGIAAIGDFSRFFRHAMSRNHQLARHLWRMLLGFFIAAGSAFTGPGASAFPDFVQASGILSIPELVILSLMVFYLIRTLFFARTAER
jgi:uncharacterized membrane protein